MIMQVTLVAALLVVFLFAMTQKRRAPVPSLMMAAVSLGGVVLAASPDSATTLAHSVGIGRGADLIFYCFIVCMLFAVLNIHLRLRAENERLTELTRTLAIHSARIPEGSK